MSRSLSILAILLVFAAGCDRGDPASETPDADRTAESAESAADAEKMRSDDWPEDPQRIVSMAPNTTEILYELGLGDRVVAVTRFCDWPEEVEQLPTIGGVIDPDHEAILGAEPDLVVGSLDGLDPDVVDQLDRADIDYGFVAMDDIDSVRRGIRTLGDWLGVRDRTTRRLEAFDDRLEAASRQVQNRLEAGETTALMVVDRDPIVAAGPGSFGDDLLSRAGLDNALGGEADDYPMLDVEKVLETDPDIIIDLTVDPEEADDGYWRDFESLKAVRSGRVVHLDDSVVLRPGPRIPEAVERLGEALETS